jgi:hypothetical protein
MSEQTEGLETYFEPSEIYSQEKARKLFGQLHDEPDEHPLSPGVQSMCRLLDEARSIVGGSRHVAYGNPKDNHTRTAAMWSAFLGVPVSPRQVCYMNILQKCSREAHWSQRDNDLDCAGYAANATACMD